MTGKDCIAVANGRNSSASGVKGCYLVLTEYDAKMNLLHCKMRKVDGKRIKENTLYTLENGVFAEVKD